MSQHDADGTQLTKHSLLAGPLRMPPAFEGLARSAVTWQACSRSPWCPSLSTPLAPAAPMSSSGNPCCSSCNVSAAGVAGVWLLGNRVSDSLLVTSAFLCLVTAPPMAAAALAAALTALVSEPAANGGTSVAAGVNGVRLGSLPGGVDDGVPARLCCGCCWNVVTGMGCWGLARGCRGLGGRLCRGRTKGWVAGRVALSWLGVSSALIAHHLPWVVLHYILPTQTGEEVQTCLHYATRRTMHNFDLLPIQKVFTTTWAC